MPYTEAEEHWLNHQYQLYDEAFLSVPLGEATMQVKSNQKATNIEPVLLGARLLSFLSYRNKKKLWENVKHIFL